MPEHQTTNTQRQEVTHTETGRETHRDREGDTQRPGGSHTETGRETHRDR